MRTLCHWRDYVEDGHLYQQLSDFPPEQCVHISPRWARVEFTSRALPYFQVHAPLRRFIWEQMTGTEYPKYGVVRHHCLKHTGIDSRGLCINPHHLSIGSSGDNRLDAREEEKLRESLGYWKPPLWEPLPPLTMAIKQDVEIHARCDEDVLWCWSGTPTPLNDRAKAAHWHCQALGQLVGAHQMDLEDQDALVKAAHLLRAMKDDKDHLVFPLIKVLQTYRFTDLTPRRKCQHHLKWSA